MSRAPRVFHPVKTSTGTVLELNANASRHLIRVLRKRAGDTVTVFNGLGGEYTCRLIHEDDRFARLKVESWQDVSRESHLIIELAQVVARGDRMDMIIQKSVELGVHRITPLLSIRCGIRLDEKRLTKKHDHWQGIITSACEQSGRNKPPKLAPCATLAEWFATMTSGQDECRLILNPETGIRLKDLTPGQGAVIRLLIGPEGGLSREEIQSAEQYGFIPVRLGPRILRTETAGLAVISSLQALWGDWQ